MQQVGFEWFRVANANEWIKVNKIIGGSMQYMYMIHPDNGYFEFCKKKKCTRLIHIDHTKCA